MTVDALLAVNGPVEQLIKSSIQDIVQEAYSDAGITGVFNPQEKNNQVITTVVAQTTQSAMKELTRLIKGDGAYQGIMPAVEEAVLQGEAETHAYVAWNQVKEFLDKKTHVLQEPNTYFSSASLTYIAQLLYEPSSIQTDIKTIAAKPQELGKKLPKMFRTIQAQNIPRQVSENTKMVVRVAATTLAILGMYAITHIPAILGFAGAMRIAMTNPGANATLRVPVAIVEQLTSTSTQSPTATLDLSTATPTAPSATLAAPADTAGQALLAAYQGSASVQDFAYRPLYERVVNERRARATAEGNDFWVRITGKNESQLTQAEKDAVLQNPVVSIPLLIADGDLVDPNGDKLETTEEQAAALRSMRNDATFVVYLNTQTGRLDILSSTRQVLMKDGTQYNALLQRDKDNPIKGAQIALEEMFGTTMDEPIVADRYFLQYLVDAIFPDGITVSIPQDMVRDTKNDKGEYPIVYKAGTYTFHGQDLVSYVSVRHLQKETEFHRQARAAQVLFLMLQKFGSTANSAEIMTNMSQILRFHVQHGGRIIMLNDLTGVQGSEDTFAAMAARFQFLQNPNYFSAGAFGEIYDHQLAFNTNFLNPHLSVLQPVSGKTITYANLLKALGVYINPVGVYVPSDVDLWYIPQPSAKSAGYFGSTRDIAKGMVNESVDEIKTALIPVAPTAVSAAALPAPEVEPTQVEQAQIPTQQPVIPAAYQITDRPIRIMLLGDSLISNGTLPTQLANGINDAGWNVTFVGSQMTGRVAHEGHGGFPTSWFVRDLLNTDGDGMWNNLGQRDPTKLLTGAENIPDIVVLQMGTNDINNGYPLEKSKANMETIISYLQQKNPHVQIVINPIPVMNNDYYPNATPEAIAAYNAMLASLATSSSTDTSGIVMTDAAQENIDLSTDIGSDGVHPNQEGDKKIAGALEQVLGGQLSTLTGVAQQANVEVAPEGSTAALQGEEGQRVEMVKMMYKDTVSSLKVSNGPQWYQYFDKNYVPPNLVNLETNADFAGLVQFSRYSNEPHLIREEAVPLLLDLARAVKAQGYTLYIADTYRSYAFQQELFDKNDGKIVVAPPGTSPHQSGYAVDLYVVDSQGTWKALPKDLVTLAETIGFLRTNPMDPPHFLIADALYPGAINDIKNEPAFIQQNSGNGDTTYGTNELLSRLSQNDTADRVAMAAGGKVLAAPAAVERAEILQVIALQQWEELQKGTETRQQDVAVQQEQVKRNEIPGPAKNMMVELIPYWLQQSLYTNVVMSESFWALTDFTRDIEVILNQDQVKIITTPKKAAENKAKQTNHVSSMEVAAQELIAPVVKTLEESENDQCNLGSLFIESVFAQGTGKPCSGSTRVIKGVYKATGRKVSDIVKGSALMPNRVVAGQIRTFVQSITTPTTTAQLDNGQKQGEHSVQASVDLSTLQGKHITDAKEIMSVVEQSLPSGKKSAEQLFSFLEQHELAIKTEEEQFLAAAAIQKREELVDVFFLNNALTHDPSLEFPLRTYDTIQKNNGVMAPAQRQVFLNRLLDPSVKAFFTLDGQPASYQEYLQDVYKGVVNVIRVDVGIMDVGLRETMLEELKRVTDPAVYNDLISEYTNLPVATVLIEYQGKTKRVPIIVTNFSGKYEDATGMAGPVLGTNIHKIFIRNESKTSLVNTFMTVSHEIDHAVRALVNDKAISSDAESTKYTSDALFRYLYQSHASAYTEDARTAIINDFSNTEMEKNKKNVVFDDYISEMGGETANDRLLRAFIAGNKLADNDLAYQAFYIKQQLYYLSRDTQLASAEKKYALGMSIGSVIEDVYGKDELLRIIHQMPADQSESLLKTVSEKAEERLRADKNINQRVVSFILSTQLGDVRSLPFSGLFSPGKIDNSINDEAEREQKTALGQITDAAMDIPENIALVSYITRLYPNKPQYWVSAFKTFSLIIHYLTDENAEVREYALAHKTYKTDTAYREELKDHVNILFSILGKGLPDANISLEDIKTYMLEQSLDRIITGVKGMSIQQEQKLTLQTVKPELSIKNNSVSIDHTQTIERKNAYGITEKYTISIKETLPKSLSLVSTDQTLNENPNQLLVEISNKNGVVARYIRRFSVPGPKFASFVHSLTSVQDAEQIFAFDDTNYYDKNLDTLTGRQLIDIEELHALVDQLYYQSVQYGYAQGMFSSTAQWFVFPTLLSRTNDDKPTSFWINLGYTDSRINRVFKLLTTLEIDAKNKKQSNETQQTIFKKQSSIASIEEGLIPLENEKWNALSLDDKATLRKTQFETARNGYEAVRSTYFDGLKPTVSDRLTGIAAKVWSATANFRRAPQDWIVRLRVLFTPSIATNLTTKTVNATVFSRGTLMTDPRFTGILEQAKKEGNTQALQTIKNLLDREVMKEVNAENVLMLEGISTEELAVIVSRLGYNPWVFLSDNRGETSRIAIDNALVDGKHPFAAEGALDGLTDAQKQKELSYFQKLFPNIPSWLQWLPIAKWSTSRDHSVVHTVTVGGKTYHFLTMHVDPKNGVTFVKDIWNKITGKTVADDRSMFAYHAMEAGTGKSYVGTGLYALGQKLFLQLLGQAKQQGIISGLNITGEEQYKTTGTIIGDDPITWKISAMVKAETEENVPQKNSIWVQEALEKMFPPNSKILRLSIPSSVLANGYTPLSVDKFNYEDESIVLHPGDTVHVIRRITVLKSEADKLLQDPSVLSFALQTYGTQEKAIAAVGTNDVATLLSRNWQLSSGTDNVLVHTSYSTKTVQDRANVMLKAALSQTPYVEITYTMDIPVEKLIQVQKNEQGELLMPDGITVENAHGYGFIQPDPYETEIAFLFDVPKEYINTITAKEISADGKSIQEQTIYQKPQQEKNTLFDSFEDPDCYADSRMRGVVYAASGGSATCRPGITMSPLRWVRAYRSNPTLAVTGLQRDISRWSASIGLGAVLTKASLGIAQLSFVKGAYDQFLAKLAQYIGPTAYVNPNFWRWNLIDYAFGIVSSGLAYLGLNVVLSKLVTNTKKRRVIAAIGTVLATVAFSLAGEIYGNITAYKGSWIDPQDWLAEVGGMTTFLLAEWVFSALKTRGITLTSMISPKIKAIGNRIALYGGISVVAFVSVVSLVYLLKLFL